MPDYKQVGTIKYPQNLDADKQALIDMLAKNYAEEVSGIENEKKANNARIRLGSAISGASFHPILNIPYVGTGIGGAMYDLGQGIVEGDEAKDLAKRAARGFAIGETVGAVPYAGKLISKTKAGQAVNKVFDDAAEKFAQTKAYDVLMSDIKGLNPFKQTAYHGSPADFEKFSNEAIGTGEGVQAHGYGHYAALNKDVADNRYRKGLLRTVEERDIDKKYRALFNEEQKKVDAEAKRLYDLRYKENKISEVEHQKALDELFKPSENIINEWRNAIENVDKTKATKEIGQLYKLSIPKKDVMLREDAFYKNQSPEVQQALKKLYEGNWDKYKPETDLAQILYTDNTLQKYGNNLAYKEGRNIYDALVNMTGSKKEAANLLNKYGIKGISYNGGIDGEAAVIFDPKEIDIVRKFYNKPEAIEYLNKMKPTSGAVADAFNAYLSREEQKKWRQFAKDNFIGKSVEVPGYTAVNFTNKNLGKDYSYNLPEYSDLLNNLQGSQYQFSTNYGNEADRLYDHLTKEDKNRLFDYLIEVIKDTEGNIHHNYKMMKNISRGDEP